MTEEEKAGSGFLDLDPDDLVEQLLRVGFDGEEDQNGQKGSPGAGLAPAGQVMDNEALAALIRESFNRINERLDNLADNFAQQIDELTQVIRDELGEKNRAPKE